MDKRQDIFENFEVPDPIRIRKSIKFIRRYFGKIDGLNVLECGIARGGVADLLEEERANTYGIDINPRQIKGVKIFQRDLNDGFPKFSLKFDVIFAGEVMEHLFDDQKFIKEARELLKPGGLLIVTVPNLVFSVNRLLMFLGRMPMMAYAPFHYQIYNKKTLLDLISRSGMEIVGLTSSHVLFSTRFSKLGRIFEILGDLTPSLGAHLIIAAKKI